MTGRRLAVATTAALLAVTGTAWAALTQEGGTYPTGTDPYAANAADFNGDGRTDIAVLNGTSSTVNFYMRQAGGGFAQPSGSPISVVSGPSYGTVGDFNGDGLSDLAVGGYPGAGVSVLLQQSGGGFTQQTFSTSPNRVGSVAAGDFNGGDGKADLVVGLYDANLIQVFTRNAGNNGFDAGQQYSVSGHPRHIAVADFNSDGRSDVATANDSSNSVSVLLQNVDHTFTREEISLTVGTSPQNIVAADFNRDGHPDIATSNGGSANVSVYLGNATGTGFTQESDSPIAVGANPTGLTSADFDQDGFVDLAVGAQGANAVDVLHNTGSGFALSEAPAVTGAYGLTSGDFDGDKRPDVAVTSLATNPGTLSVLLNPAPPVTPTPTPTPTATATPLPSPVAGKNVNVVPTGKVKLKLPGKKTFTTIDDPTQIPVGSEVDTKDGRVTITTAKTGESADFYDGIFKLSQTKGKKPLTTLTLSEVLSCPKAKKASAAAKKPKTRRLWGSGKGNFRTSGKYSAATIRGTQWLVADTCTTTKTTVKKGVVSVRDNVKRRTKIVRAKHSYTARAKR